MKTTSTHTAAPRPITGKFTRKTHVGQRIVMSGHRPGEDGERAYLVHRDGSLRLETPSRNLRREKRARNTARRAAQRAQVPA